MATAPSDLVPELRTVFRHENLCCDIREAWRAFSSERLLALELAEYIYAICQDPVSGASRALLLDEFGRAALERIDGTKSMRVIGAELQPEFGSDAEVRVRKIFDLIERANLSRDTSAEPPPDAYRASVLPARR